VFSLINPIPAVALAFAFLAGSNFALQLWAGVGSRKLLSYAIYVGTAFVLGAMWYFSIISATEAVIVFVPVMLGYLVVSWAGKST
jgi:hypothetical protein